MHAAGFHSQYGAVGAYGHGLEISRGSHQLSPDGNSIALSDLDGSLKVVDRRSGTARTISRTGSMMDLAFTADGIVSLLAVRMPTTVLLSYHTGA